MKIAIRYFVLFILLLMAASIGFAASPVESDRSNTKIVSDSMVYDSGNRKVTFSKNVRVTHPDFTLTAEKLTLLLTGSESTEQLEAGKIERIIAEKKVRISLPENRKASCEKAIYTVEDEKLVMEGNPVLSENDSQISGKRIIFSFKDKQSEVQGGVRVDFNNKDDGANSRLKFEEFRPASK